MPTKDFTSVTEVTGYKVTQEQIKRMYTRYHFARELCQDKDVLEAACGSGQGLGYLAGKAKKVIGLDIDSKLVKLSQEYYEDRENIQIRQGDAQDLPFSDQSFDVVIMFEAIYYLPAPEKFISEAYRVLKKSGILVICTANKDWSDFNPSPYSYKYFSATELASLLKKNRFNGVSIYADCPVVDKDIKGKLTSQLKKTAVALHIIPKTMKGKEALKRIFCGRLIPLPAEIQDEMYNYTPPVKISGDLANPEYKVLFAVGYK
jgi:ubiquinone/menaquinone biosynthesis C-methylase UbiE